MTTKVDLPPGARRVRLWNKPDSTRYGSWSNDSNGKWLLIDGLTYSDYSGSFAEESNVRVFCGEFPRGEDVWWTNAIGGHGTVSILVHIRAYQWSKEVRETLNCLADSICIDEDDWSDLEFETSESEWTNESHGGRKELRRLLTKRLENELYCQREGEGDADDDGNEADVIIDRLTDDQIDCVYNEFCEKRRCGERYTAEGRNILFYPEECAEGWDGLVPELDEKHEVIRCTGEVIAWKPVAFVEKQPVIALPSKTRSTIRA
jgi:hypothetical protein